MQQKLEEVQTRNENLLRQNQVYQQDIEGLQSRLI